MDRHVDLLRTSLEPLHRQLDAVPYARAALAGSLPIALYSRFLRAVHTVLEAVEQSLEVWGDSELRALFSHTIERRGLLERDLAYLQVDMRDVDAALLQALVLAQRIRRDARASRDRLLGHAYVLEGSTLGGVVQAATLAHRPELQRGGRAYLEGAGKATRADFEDFLRRLAAALQDPAAAQQAVTGGRTIFEGFLSILNALDPAKQDVRWLVAELNPEAGTHSIPSDVREVQAAILAGEESYRRFGYYEARYGERGLRFTRSDSAWLASLARDDEGESTQHVRWLGRVLAARGMPRILLEHHLGLLHEFLTAHAPELEGAYGALKNAQAELQSAREANIPAAQAATLIDSFLSALREERATAAAAANRSGPRSNGTPPRRSPGELDPDEDELTECGVSAREAGMLLVAAVADELHGVPHAVAALTSWLCESTRFSPAWTRASQRTLRVARRRI